MRQPYLNLVLAAVGLTVAASVVAAAASSQPKAIEAGPSEPQPEPERHVVICHPHDHLAPPFRNTLGPWCAESIAFYTCWRHPGHTGRHVAYDLSTGAIEAVWPCEPGRFALADPGMEAA